MLRSLVLLLAFSGSLLAAEETAPKEQAVKPVQVYSQDELLSLIAVNKHLRRVLDDDCQLVQDIEARAEVAKVPAYQYLWGDMLAYGVCVPTNVTLGISYMEKAADQGLPEALEQLGRYYATGKWVQIDMHRAMVLLRMANKAHYLKATLRFADLASKGYGVPEDREQALEELKNAVIPNRDQWRQAQRLIARLEKQLPPSVVARISER
ncbi:flagellar protein MotX [Gallaecimonas kandeliae]|uniref:tetratricopeptide repeat protein n=1 Tax=Gallaecimonas kandeliae TaxID=3029055 RepID=UPI002649BE1E|nr:flagellar protein MotX [Gallaecimonas kandeliae]WKE64990.1 flagellar protein MotX [Gallaecimonas kandeliae]